MLLHGNFEDNLNALRHKCFCEKVATRSVYVQPQSLAPNLLQENIITVSNSMCTSRS